MKFTYFMKEVHRSINEGSTTYQCSLLQEVHQSVQLLKIFSRKKTDGIVILEKKVWYAEYLMRRMHSILSTMKRTSG